MTQHPQWPDSWHIDSMSPHEIHGHHYREVLTEKQTAYQKMTVCRTSLYGKALILDGKIQSTQLDEFIYHEALVHPALLAVENPIAVLVIGGGEGATLREIYRHPTVERAVMVDIDGDVVNACREHLVEFHQGAFDDARTELVIEDAKTYVERQQAEGAQFDVVLIDISEALEGSTATYMYTQEFYRQIVAMLKPRGKMVVQSGSLSMVEQEFFLRVNATLRTQFSHVTPYRAYVDSYGADWAFNLVDRDGSDPSITAAEVDRRLQERGITAALRFYDGETHRGMLSISKQLRAELAKKWPPFTVDAKPRIYAASP